MRNNLAPALIGSALLHVAVFGFALWKFPNETREVLNAVPVQIVSDMPALAPAPPAPPTMEETPEPEPVEEAAPEPTPEPVPTPAPPKPTPPKPEPKPTPKPEKAPPKPAKKPEADVDPLAFVKDLSKASSKPRASQADRPTKGTSRSGPADADMGPAINALGDRLNRLWNPNCGVEGADELIITVRVVIAESGRVVRKEVINRRSNPVWDAAATRALGAVTRGQPYENLPDGLYNEELDVVFDGKKACR